MEVTGEWNYTMMSFVICYCCWLLSVSKARTTISARQSVHGDSEKCWLENVNGRDCFSDIGVDGGNIISLFYLCLCKDPVSSRKCSVPNRRMMWKKLVMAQFQVLSQIWYGFWNKEWFLRQTDVISCLFNVSCSHLLWRELVL